MTQDFAQRRRVAVALAITVIAAPMAFLLNRSSGDDEPTMAATFETLVGTVAPAGGTASPAVPQTESPDDTDP